MARVIFLSLLLVWTSSGAADKSCVTKGQIYTRLPWYGYLLQRTFQVLNAKVEYQISYPAKDCCTNLLIYFDDQIKVLKDTMSCHERVGVLPSDNNQVIPLNETGGCTLWKEAAEPLYVCTGERQLHSIGPRTWYFAISRCDAPNLEPITLNYFFNFTGHYGDCEADPLTRTIFPVKVPDDPDISIVVSLGVLCGVLLIAVVIMSVYIVRGKRRRQKSKKTGSVTSSQATMTQDIFYVNPSLSDREHSDNSQYSHSQSSGSENYYEVIPDRRSYESINTQLALQGRNIRGLNQTMPRERRGANVPAYILEDYPPPPYQPPRTVGSLPNGNHQRQISASAVLQNGNHYASRGVPVSNSIEMVNGRVPQVLFRNDRLYPLSHVTGNMSPQGIQASTQLSESRPTSGEQSSPGHGQDHVPDQHISGTNRMSVPEIVQSPNRQSNPDLLPVMTRPSAVHISPQSGLAISGNARPDITSAFTPIHQASLSPGSQQSSANFVRQQVLGKTQQQPHPNIQLQSYGRQSMNAISASGNNNNVPNGTNGQLPNGNVAKLLHDAYRIQQFETTA